MIIQIGYPTLYEWKNPEKGNTQKCVPKIGHSCFVIPDTGHFLSFFVLMFVSSDVSVQTFVLLPLQL
jgi:hypothetical protein